MGSFVRRRCSELFVVEEVTAMRIKKQRSAIAAVAQVASGRISLKLDLLSLLLRACPLFVS